LPSFARAPEAAPTALWLVLVLTAMVGLPFFVLSSASPTTQRWFALLPGGIEPYRLFAASNLGSLIGLVAYPTIVEPNLDLPDQARWWSIGFALFVVLTAATGVVVVRKGRPFDVAIHVDEPNSSAEDFTPIRRSSSTWCQTRSAMPRSVPSCRTPSASAARTLALSWRGNRSKRALSANACRVKATSVLRQRHA